MTSLEEMLQIQAVSSGARNSSHRFLQSRSSRTAKALQHVKLVDSPFKSQLLLQPVNINRLVSNWLTCWLQSLVSRDLVLFDDP